jgi:hypothetical protein
MCTCHSSYGRKYKIRRSQSRPAWTKTERVRPYFQITRVIRAGRVPVPVHGPEFKLQYRQKKKKQNIFVIYKSCSDQMQFI